jgi:peptide/nickel transport system ATP-binding protein
MSLLEVRDLRTEIRRGHDVVRPVDGISFDVAAGETVGLVGESGCGKSMTGMSIMGLLPPGGQVASGSIRLGGRELTSLTEAEMRKVRGGDVGVVFQDPMTSLNPTMTIGKQIAEAVQLHTKASKAQAMRRAEEVLGLVGMPRPSTRLDDYPHQLSGGMRQRVMIALALSCEPRLLIADEPTTALDVTIQAQILDLLEDLRQRLDMGVLLVTHDLGVIAGRADRVLVMYAGRIVGSGETGDLFDKPQHPYTEALLDSTPRLDQDGTQALRSIPGLPPDLAHPPTGCRFAPRCTYAADFCRENDPDLAVGDTGQSYACFFPRSSPRRELLAVRPSVIAPAEERAIGSTLLEVRDVHKEYESTKGFFGRAGDSVKAVSGVSFDVRAGETFAIVGESGCGKSTLGRLIVSLERPSAGEIRFDGVALSSLRSGELRRRRRDIQLMFQDSGAALDPRMKIGASLQEPLDVQRMGDRRSRKARLAEILDQVGLPQSSVERYPHQFSGGQRQRIGMARALTVNPRLIVADEPVSALDVSIQSQVLNLMKSLQKDLGLTYVVISHDLAVVKYLADRVGVMYLGTMVEVGPAERIYSQPAHPYTTLLLDANPEADPVRERERSRTVLAGELPSALEPPSGCRFRTRCPRVQELCAVEEPPLRLFGAGHEAACHFPLQPALEPESVGAAAAERGV